MPAGRPWLVWTLLAALAACAAWVFSTAWPLLRAEFPTLSERHLVQQWSSGAAGPESRPQWIEVRAALLEAAKLQPEDPALQELLGNLHRVGVQQTWATESERAQWLGQAVANYRRSLQLRPSDPLSWALLASALAESGQFGPPMVNAVEQAVKLGPNETHVRQTVLELTLKNWEQAPDSMKQWAVDLYEQGTESQRQAINTMAGSYGLRFETDKPPRQLPPRR